MRPLLVWLYACCAMIVAMALIGAITRLTESGLSITRWEPVTGVVPPMSEAAWERAFALYRQTPQYRAINAGMELAAFKNIFFWEWLHRLWGRLIGLAYALPLAFFWLKGMIPAGFKKPLLAALALGGLQGFIGWFMVQSGLVEGMLSVSAYRLVLHLGLALLIYAFLYWQILRLRGTAPLADGQACRTHTLFALLLLSLTIFWGAFTAGLDAGKIYPSFPLMNGHVVPPDALSLTPFWRNFFENPAAVQFAHRVLAFFSLGVLLALAVRLYRRSAVKTGGLLAAAAAAQVALGIATLLSGIALPLAVAHQANAIFLLSVMVHALYLTRARST